MCLQFLQGFRVLGIVPGRGHYIAGQGRQFHGHLILLGQFVPCFEIDLEFGMRTRFPPRGIVVIPGSLVKSHLQIVIGSYPIRGVKGAGLKCLEDLSSRQDLHRGPHPSEHLTAEAGNPHLQSHNVIQRTDLAIEPSPYLSNGSSGWELDDVEPIPGVAAQLADSGSLPPVPSTMAVQA